jgi:hypothetical protein
VSDFQDRGPAHGGPTDMRGPGGDGGGGGAAGSVHQVVFRWDGNHGRQGTGMNAVAHSCEPERAEELGRELGPLLWVSGAAAARPSVVRTLSRDGDVMLVQRWPTTDRGGRPSTVSHVLIGDRGTLKVGRCLGLAYGGWRRQEKAEQASGRLPGFDCADLDELAWSRLPDMLELLPTVRHALILATAELLRDPAQRVSLLLEEETPRDWPDRDSVPLVYLGLFLLFGPWLDQPWTFATCDAVDTHPLRLMSVPRWEPDAGGSGPLARIMGRRPDKPRFEHRAAARLVEHLLAHRQAAPGVPHLVEALADGAALDWEQRRTRLQEILGSDRPTSTRPTAPTLPPAPPGPEWDREREGDREREWARARAGAGEPAQATIAPETYPETHPEACPATHTDTHPHSYPDGYPGAYPDGYPNPTPKAPPPIAPARPLPPPTNPTVHDTRALHRNLRDHQHGDVMRRSLLMAELRRQPDESLLHELRSGELPPDSLDLVLGELGEPDRVRARHPEMRHELCAEVLRNNLYFSPYGQGTELVSSTAMADRAADLFTWAVAPLVRDERYLRDLRELLHGMSRVHHPTAGNWLRRSIIEPANGQVPDLPPVLWAQILRDMPGHYDRPVSVPPSPHATPVAAAPAQQSALTTEPLTVAARISDLTNNPGCVIGSGVCFCVVGVLIAIVWFFG